MLSLFKELTAQSKKVYGERLISLAIFGSWAGERNTSESDVDILIVAKDLSKKRLERVKEFDEVEKSLEATIEELAQEGIHTYLSPIFKTPEEVLRGSLLFLDMLDDLILLYDKDSFFQNYLAKFRKRLDKLGAKKVIRGENWFWILKPDYSKGETFKL